MKGLMEEWVAESTGQKQSHPECLVAPLWHSLLLCVIAFVPSVLLGITRPSPTGFHPRFVRLSFLEIALYCSVLAFVYWGLKLHRTPLSRVVGGNWFNSKRVWSDVCIGTLLASLCLAVSWMLNAVFGSFENNPSFIVAPTTTGQLLAAILAAGSAGLTEEVLFRGYALRQLYCLNQNWLLAVMLQAAAFVFVHGLRQTPGEVFFELFVGIAFGVVTLRRNSLLAPVIAHFELNASAHIIRFALY